MYCMGFYYDNDDDDWDGAYCGKFSRFHMNDLHELNLEVWSNGWNDNGWNIF